MGRGCVLLTVAVAGCNSIFGLAPTHEMEPAIPGLFMPPAGPTTCAGAPDFATWQYTPHVVAGTPGVLHPTFLTADRVVFMMQGHLFESGLDGGVVRLTSLELYDGENLASPAAGPGGDVIWFLRLYGSSQGLYYATRDADGWAQARTDFGVISEQVQPGTVGFYDGTGRMVIAMQRTSMDRGRLVELESEDGLSWTQLDTLPFSDGSVSMYDPALSADGCFVLYSVYGNATNDLYVAARGGDGVFAAPVHLDKAAGGAQPAIDPSLHELWFNQLGGGLVQATP